MNSAINIPDSSKLNYGFLIIEMNIFLPEKNKHFIINSSNPKKYCFHLHLFTN